MENNFLELPLRKISDSAIKVSQIRAVDKNSTHYTALVKQIKIDGQKIPIMIRRLRAQEITEEYEYGILDGHHRFAALQELGKEKILAEVVESENEITDLIKSTAPNLTHNSLAGWQIGEILVKLKAMTNRKLEYVAADFGIARSTAFKYQAAYKKHSEKDVVERNETKSQIQYDPRELQQVIKNFNCDDETDTLESYDRKMAQVKVLTDQLTAYKRYLRDKIKELKNTTVN